MYPLVFAFSAQSPLSQRDATALPRGDLGRRAANIANLGHGGSINGLGIAPQSPAASSRMSVSGSPKSLPNTPGSNASKRSRTDWSEDRRRGKGRRGGGDGGGDDDDGDGDGGGGGGGGDGGADDDGDGGSPPGSPSGNGDGMGIMQGIEGAVIWGTNVNVNESMARFRQFLLEFCLDDEDEPLYKAQLEEVHRTQVNGGKPDGMVLCVWNFIASLDAVPFYLQRNFAY